MAHTHHVETTHKVTNQPPPLQDYGAYALDAPLREFVARADSPWLEQRLSAYGRLVASAEQIELGAQANANPPRLHTHDRFGYRIDEVEYHPAYHELMRRAAAHEVHSVAWSHPGHPAHAAHAALLYLHAQAEAGTACPLTMTHACVPALRTQPELAEPWVPRVLTAAYDPRSLPAEAKTGVQVGMAMTEKQGGSDVRANSTTARALGSGGPGQPYELTGHKWFCSAPMCDAFLTLAQAPGGLSCFLLPRFRPDGTRNRILIQRLKDKLGNRSNASSEIEYDRAFAWLVGEEGRGVPAIIRMVAATRVDCAAGSAGLMRRALVEAVHHARHRAAFGLKLVEQPLMTAVLADLALESEAATALALRVASSYDAQTEAERSFGRVATAIAKYWVTRRAPGFVFEAMECLGGAGYVEESALPRLYREAPVNSIWEGSGNVQCLDVLRALHREPAAADALQAELDRARGANRHFDAELRRAGDALRDAAVRPAQARHTVELLARLLAAGLLLRYAPAQVADAYCATRLGGERGSEYGAVCTELDVAYLVERAFPGTVEG